MKNHFQIPLLLTCVGTLSTSLFIFAPATHARCYNSYGTTVDCDLQRQSEIRNGQQEQMKQLNNIIQDTRPKFGSDSSYQSTPSQPTYTAPTYTREQELNTDKRLGEAFLDCLEQGGRIADCRETRVLR